MQSPFIFEKANEYGRWNRIRSSSSNTIPFNSSHTYPLTLDDYAENVIALVDGKPVKTLYVEIRLTNLCNHDCRGCFSKDKRTCSKESLNHSIPYDRLVGLITEINEQGTAFVRFSGGGEPLLYSGIDNILAKTFQHGIGTMLITNGSLLHKRDQNNLVENLNMLRVSINGGETTHSEIHCCNENDFRTILNSLGTINALRTPKLKEQLYVGVTYLVFPENIREISATAKQLKDCGVDGIFFRASNNHRQFDKYNLDFLKEEINKTRVLGDSNFFVHFASRLLDAETNPSVNDTHCCAAQFRLYIEATGQVSVCGKWAGTNQFQLGNINESSLKRILENNPVLCSLRNTSKMNCVGCDCAYFNKAMHFIKNEYFKDKNVSFKTV